jgi:hypothetical protein
VSHELKNSKKIKGVFKVDLLQVAHALNADELGDIEKTPETIPGELVSAAFKGQLDIVEKVHFPPSSSPSPSELLPLS